MDRRNAGTPGLNERWCSLEKRAIANRGMIPDAIRYTRRRPRTGIGGPGSDPRDSVVALPMS